MKYLKKFEHHTDYEAYKNGQNYLTPNVSYCVDLNEVHFNKYVRDYSKEYLTTKALGTGTISFNIWYAMGTEYITSISYSTDNGNTWSTIINEDNKENNLSIDVNMNDGDIIIWKGNAEQLGFYSDDDSDYEGSFFSSTCEFDVSGNVMSMLYGDNFIGRADYMNTNGIFSCLFYDYYEEHTCMVKSSKDLILPATTLADNCYGYMFSGCTSLTTAPELPATTLASSCYGGMFNGCTSLTTAPELPATTLASDCYSYMFNGCTSLTTAPELPATTLAERCYSSMFTNCAALTTAPELPATTLADYCYSSMFSGCTSLTTAPELPATTLADYCYNYMFVSCTALTTAPELPATTLASSCYQCMFQNCTALTTAPELPATILASGCYSFMFQDCTALITAPELPATTLASDCYGYMFYGCTGLITASELPATTLASDCYGYMFQGCTSLTTAPELPATTLAERCYRYMFRNCSRLAYIKAMFTTTPSTTYTSNWVSGVSATGTFVKNSAAQWNVTGVNGIPSGWTVQTASS